MTNIHRPDPATITQLIETDKVIRYVVEELGGEITAIRKLRKPLVIDPVTRKGRKQDYGNRYRHSRHRTHVTEQR